MSEKVFMIFEVYCGEIGWKMFVRGYDSVADVYSAMKRISEYNYENHYKYFNVEECPIVDLRDGLICEGWL